MDDHDAEGFAAKYRGTQGTVRRLRGPAKRTCAEICPQRLTSKWSSELFPTPSLHHLTTMADQARIRTYQPGDADLKLARFSIGKAQMEGLAVANRRSECSYSHCYICSD